MAKIPQPGKADTSGQWPSRGTGDKTGPTAPVGSVPGKGSNKAPWPARGISEMPPCGDTKHPGQPASK